MYTNVGCRVCCEEIRRPSLLWYYWLTYDMVTDLVTDMPPRKCCKAIPSLRLKFGESGARIKTKIICTTCQLLVPIAVGKGVMSRWRISPIPLRSFSLPLALFVHSDPVFCSMKSWSPTFKFRPHPASSSSFPPHTPHNTTTIILFLFLSDTPRPNFA